MSAKKPKKADKSSAKKHSKTPLTFDALLRDASEDEDVAVPAHDLEEDTKLNTKLTTKSNTAEQEKAQPDPRIRGGGKHVPRYVLPNSGLLLHSKPIPATDPQEAAASFVTTYDDGGPTKHSGILGNWQWQHWANSVGNYREILARAHERQERMKAERKAWLARQASNVQRRDAKRELSKEDLLSPQSELDDDFGLRSPLRSPLLAQPSWPGTPQPEEDGKDEPEETPAWYELKMRKDQRNPVSVFLLDLYAGKYSDKPRRLHKTRTGTWKTTSTSSPTGSKMTTKTTNGNATTEGAEISNMEMVEYLKEHGVKATVKTIRTMAAEMQSSGLVGEGLSALTKPNLVPPQTAKALCGVLIGDPTAIDRALKKSDMRQAGADREADVQSPEQAGHTRDMTSAVSTLVHLIRQKDTASTVTRQSSPRGQRASPSPPRKSPRKPKNKNKDNKNKTSVDHPSGKATTVADSEGSAQGEQAKGTDSKSAKSSVKHDENLPEHFRDLGFDSDEEEPVEEVSEPHLVETKALESVSVADGDGGDGDDGDVSAWSKGTRGMEGQGGDGHGEMLQSQRRRVNASDREVPQDPFPKVESGASGLTLGEVATLAAILSAEIARRDDLEKRMEERQKNRYLALQARAKAMSEREERVQGRLLQMRDDRDHKLKRAAKQRAKQLQDAVRRAEELEALREEQVAQAMKERQQRWEDRHKKMQIKEDQKRQERKKAKAEEARIRDRYRQHKSSLEKAVERLSMHSPGPDVSQSPT